MGVSDASARPASTDQAKQKFGIKASRSVWLFELDVSGRAFKAFNSCSVRHGVVIKRLSARSCPVNTC